MWIGENGFAFFAFVIGVENETFVSVLFEEYNAGFWESVESYGADLHCVGFVYAVAFIGFVKPSLKELHRVFGGIAF